MFKKVLGILVIFSMVIGEGMVSQAVRYEAKRAIEEHHLKLEKWLREKYTNDGLSSKEFEQNVKAYIDSLKEKELELKERLRKYYILKGIFQNMSPTEIEDKLEIDISLTVDQTDILGIPEQIEKLEKMVINGTLFHPSKQEADYVSLILSDIGRTMYPQEVPVLIKMFKICKNAYVRACAIGCLGVIGEKSTIPILIEALKDGDKGVCMAAATGLVELGKKSHPLLLSVLIDTLKGKEKDKWVISGWGGIGTIDKKELQLLKDKRREICRKQAIDLLVEIGSDDGKKAIKEALKDQVLLVRINASGALIKLGEDISVVLPVLIDGLKYKDDPLCIDASYFLEELLKKGNKQAISALKEALKNENKDISEGANEILKKIGKKSK